MRYLVFLFSFFLLNSCSTKKNFPGLYGKCGKNYYVCDQLELNSDNTFEYFSFMDVGGSTVVKGVWEKISDDTIILNSFERPQNSKTKISGKINSESKEISVKIIERGLPLPSSEITINNDTKITDESGFTKFKQQKVVSITYQFLNRKETIYLDNSDFNEIVLIVKDLDFDVNSKYFIDKSVKIKNNKLFINDNLVLKKTDIKNKQWN